MNNFIYKFKETFLFYLIFIYPTVIMLSFLSIKFSKSLIKKRRKAAKTIVIVLLILLILLIFIDIIFYFLVEERLQKILYLISIFISIDIILILNFLIINFNINSSNFFENDFFDINNNYNKRILKSFNDNFKKKLIYLITLIIISNLFFTSLLFCFYVLSFPINFYIVIIATFILFIILFQLFEKLKKIDNTKDQKN